MLQRYINVMKPERKNCSYRQFCNVFRLQWLPSQGVPWNTEDLNATRDRSYSNGRGCGCKSTASKAYLVLCWLPRMQWYIYNVNVEKGLLMVVLHPRTMHRTDLAKSCSVEARAVDRRSGPALSCRCAVCTQELRAMTSDKLARKANCHLKRERAPHRMA